MRGLSPGMQRPADNPAASYPSGAYRDILTLQRGAGNRAVRQLLQSGASSIPAVQFKLMIGRSGDRYEQEADRVADQVMQGSHKRPAQATLSAGARNIQRACAACSSGGGKCPQCEQEEIQRKPLSSTISPLIQRQSDIGQQRENGDATSLSSVTSEKHPVRKSASGLIGSLRNGGERLPGPSRAFFESRLHYDFGQVRTHTGPRAEEAARSVNARAFTIGRDVFFGAGQYAPDTSEGQRLLAHELTHVVQQTSSSSHRASTIQRQAASNAPTATPERDKDATTAGMIVEDTATDLQPGQMKKSDFIDQLQTAICAAADTELAAVGRNTKGCPHIERWLRYYRTRSGQQVERTIRRYAPEAAGVSSARDYIPVVSERVRRAVAVWAKTGKITGVPEGASQAPPETAPSKEGETTGAATGMLQFKEGAGGAKSADSPAAVRAQLNRGRHLDSGVRSRMESAFGYDFSRVRIHTDTKAAGLSSGLNARAFTIGSDVAFASGEYQPGTLIGDALIAHELAHVVQQGDKPTAAMHKGGSERGGLEEDADRSAVGAVVSLWGGFKSGMANIAKNAMPRLTSGLRLQRCSAPVNKAPLIIRADDVLRTWNQCGGFAWDINWITNGRSGFIVQEITNTYSAKDCTGAADTTVAPTPHFYEAWQVDARGYASPNQVTQLGRVADLWRRPDRMDANGSPGSQGDWSTNGKAYWATSLDPAASFRPGAVPDAKLLQSTTTRPTNLGSSLLERRVGGIWDCCAGQNKHDPVL